VQLNGFIGALPVPGEDPDQCQHVSPTLQGYPAIPSVATANVGSGALPGRYDVSVAFLAKGQVTSSTNGYTRS
jgi:hypothetical protein